MAYDATQDDALRRAHAWLVSADVKFTRLLEMVGQASCEIECVVDEHPELQTIVDAIDAQHVRLAIQAEDLRKVQGAILGLLKAHGGERRAK